MTAAGHDFGVLVWTGNFPNLDRRILSFAVTDETTGWYKDHETDIAESDYTWGASGLNIKMPGLTWTGNAQKMSVKATTPWGCLDVHLEATGPDLKYAGTGTFPSHGVRSSPTWQYDFPSMRTTGSLTIQGQTHNVSGESWMARQWGRMPMDDPWMRWTWMILSLPCGDKAAIWDIVSGETENCWVTVLHPDGSYGLAAVKPLADGADKLWASPATGKAYPTRWRVDIPSLKTHLTMHSTSTEAREFTGGLSPHMEVTAAFTGAYEGREVTGRSHVQMVGNWSPQPTSPRR
ncbi:lipocalin-like domain-containing protein [Dactylosporangium darangshiense]|uniref:lipocalin-like domain-containing protein n=1 Tax=Dactylosporangium darangshiense TaxID=579108 RepID=UPI0031ED82C8